MCTEAQLYLLTPLAAAGYLRSRRAGYALAGAALAALVALRAWLADEEGLLGAAPTAR